MTVWMCVLMYELAVWLCVTVWMCVLMNEIGCVTVWTCVLLWRCMVPIECVWVCVERRKPCFASRDSKFSVTFENVRLKYCLETMWRCTSRRRIPCLRLFFCKAKIHYLLNMFSVCACVKVRDDVNVYTAVLSGDAWVGWIHLLMACHAKHIERKKSIDVRQNSR